MVSFSCEACGDVVKKPKLDAHKGSQCSNAQFTCLDCNETFQGTSYRAHNSCITEKEKYEGGAAKGKKQKKVKIETNGIVEPPAPAVVASEPMLDVKDEAEEPPKKKQKKDKKEKKKPKSEVNGDALASTDMQVDEPAPVANGMQMNPDRAERLDIVPSTSNAPGEFISLNDADWVDEDDDDDEKPAKAKKEKKEKKEKKDKNGKKRKRETLEDFPDGPIEYIPQPVSLTTATGRPKTPAEIKKDARRERRLVAAAKRDERKRKRLEKAARRKVEKREHIGRLQKERDPDSPIARLYKFVALLAHDVARPMPLSEIMPLAVQKLQQDLGGDEKEYHDLFMREVKILSAKGRLRFLI